MLQIPSQSVTAAMKLVARSATGSDSGCMATDTLCGRLRVRALDHIRRLVLPPSLCRPSGAPALSDAHQFGEPGQAVDSRVVVGVAVGGGVERECEE